jgi:hypothetical protein
MYMTHRQAMRYPMFVTIAMAISIILNIFCNSRVRNVFAGFFLTGALVTRMGCWGHCPWWPNAAGCYRL